MSIDLRLLAVGATFLAAGTIGASAQAPPAAVDRDNTTATESQVQRPPTDPQSRREKNSSVTQGARDPYVEGPVPNPQPGAGDPKQLPGMGRVPRGG